MFSYFCQLIDADVLCVGSLEAFNQIDIFDYYIAAVEDLGMTREDVMALGISGKYFNSGGLCCTKIS